MATPPATVLGLLQRLRDLRVRAGISEQQLEEQLILGPGWISRFESGASVPSLDMLLAILSALGCSPNELFQGLEEGSAAEIERHLYAIPDQADLLIHFKYTGHDAVYRLPGASIAEIEEVLKILRDGLARLATADKSSSEAIKTQAVARSFLKAAMLWPHANPSDLWWFLISRAYCDPFNHPAQFARLDLGQSWKRTSGWALEEILVQFYGPFLARNGIRLFIAPSDEKERLLSQLQVPDRLESDKVDILITTSKGGQERCRGVVHVKASFAERRTDDVPLSRMLVNAGYISPLWTMDCKSTPDPQPQNRGELGPALQPQQRDTRSAKRKDIEDDGYFSACFSYNANTVPTPASQKSRARIIVCDFSSPDDAFSKFIIRSIR